MPAYELLYIVRPDLDEETIQSVVDRVNAAITDHGGQVDQTEKMGKRRLAYQIKGYNEGVYTLVQFKAEPSFIQELQRQLRINDNILRHLVVREDE